MFTPAPVSTSKFRIAFESNRVIYVMNADGSGQTRLTSNGTRDGYPAWSPDGTKIAFIDPTWSPDGTKIAFYSLRSFNGDIYVMNADGSGQTRLTNNEAYDITPVWSPDGMKIAFGSDRDGNFEIYVMNVDGSGQTRLTNNDARDSNPAWSPRLR
jgi:TolB protein